MKSVLITRGMSFVGWVILASAFFMSKGTTYPTGLPHLIGACGIVLMLIALFGAPKSADGLKPLALYAPLLLLLMCLPSPERTVSGELFVLAAATLGLVFVYCVDIIWIDRKRQQHRRANTNPTQ